MSNPGKGKKGPDLSFFQKFNRPSVEYNPATSGAWSLMKERFQKSDIKGGEAKDGSDVFEDKKDISEPTRDGKDSFQIKKEEKDLPSRDGKDFFHNAGKVLKEALPDGLDSFEKEKKESDEKSKVDKWERKYEPEKLPGEDILVKSEEEKLDLPSPDSYKITSEEVYGFVTEKASALHLQLIDLSYGLEKRVIPFNNRQIYIKEIENYMWRKKKSLSRFYKSDEAGLSKIKFFLNRGFQVFSQSLGELKMYLKDDSPMHLTISRQLSEEGNRMFFKAKEKLDRLRGVRLIV